MSDQDDSSQATTGGDAPPRAAALYPRWANASLRLCLLFLALSFLGVPTFLIAWARTPYASGAFEPQTQPVMFDHRHHTRDDGIDCRYCHGAVDKSAAAGVPSSEVCMNCHAQIWNDAPVLALVRASFFSGKPIRWQRVFNVPDFVFFSHAAHVNRNVGCVSCHGRIDLAGNVFMSQAMTMDWCIDCHRAPQDRLRPLDRITDMEWDPGPARRAIGRQIRAENQIEPPTHCSGCHR